MPDIKYNDLKKYLKELGPAQFAQVYLIHGEEFLYRKALEELLNIMVPGSKKEFNYEPIDGIEGDFLSGIEKLNTFSFMSGITVVAFCDSGIFYSKNEESKLLEKAKEAFGNKDMKKASKHLAGLLSILNLTYDDISKGERKSVLKESSDLLSDDKWLDELIGYSQNKSLSIPPPPLNNSELLHKTILKGFPKGNHLIITTDYVDKRRALFKSIKECGVIIDCSVPKGERHADRQVQETILYEYMRATLAENGKSANKEVFKAIYEKTGFDMRVFSGNLEKLINYVGTQKQITIDDVKSILKRTKSDPIYEFTNAIADRNLEQALFYMGSLISGDVYPLQILAAMVNQIRRLLVVKDFTESTYGRGWYQGINYNQFRDNVMPALIEYDNALAEQIEQWDIVLVNEKASKGKKKKKPKSGLFIVKNPGNPYPVYQTLLKSENYTKAELINNLQLLGKADLRFKRSEQLPKLICEDVIINICR